jgi:hypothetical protein
MKTTATSGDVKVFCKDSITAELDLCQQRMSRSKVYDYPRQKSLPNAGYNKVSFRLNENKLYAWSYQYQGSKVSETNHVAIVDIFGFQRSIGMFLFVVYCTDPKV